MCVCGYLSYLFTPWLWPGLTGSITWCCKLLPANRCGRAWSRASPETTEWCRRWWWSPGKVMTELRDVQKWCDFNWRLFGASPKVIMCSGSSRSSTSDFSTSTGSKILTNLNIYIYIFHIFHLNGYWAISISLYMSLQSVCSNLYRLVLPTLKLLKLLKWALW